MNAARRWFLRRLLFAMLAAPPRIEAQQVVKSSKIGYLAYEPASYEKSFNNALRRLGWEEGGNLTVERRYSQSPAGLSQYAAELVRWSPDVIVTSSAGLTRLVTRETTRIPIVVIVAGDLVAAGLVDNLARPGGNVTGSQIVQYDLIGKRLQLLKEVMAGVSRVAALTGVLTSDPVGTQENRKRFESEARALALEPQWLEVSVVGEIEESFKSMVRQHAQALIVLGSPFTFAHARLLTDLASKYRIPATYEAKVFVIGGGLMSYGVDFDDVFARGAAFVDKVLRGAKPRDLPVEQPTRFELVINLRTAKTLGLAIPKPVLLRADQIIR